MCNLFTSTATESLQPVPLPVEFSIWVSRCQAGWSEESSGETDNSYKGAKFKTDPLCSGSRGAHSMPLISICHHNSKTMFVAFNNKKKGNNTWNDRAVCMWVPACCAHFFLWWWQGNLECNLSFLSREIKVYKSSSHKPPTVENIGSFFSQAANLVPKLWKYKFSENNIFCKLALLPA